MIGRFLRWLCALPGQLAEGYYRMGEALDRLLPDEPAGCVAGDPDCTPEKPCAACIWHNWR